MQDNESANTSSGVGLLPKTGPDFVKGPDNYLYQTAIYATVLEFPEKYLFCCFR